MTTEPKPPKCPGCGQPIEGLNHNLVPFAMPLETPPEQPNNVVYSGVVMVHSTMCCGHILHTHDATAAGQVRKQQGPRIAQ